MKKSIKPKKTLSQKEALHKLEAYCAYQDRCHKEVRTKLLDLGIYGDELEEIIAELITENFLNEERYARSFARGKFRMKKWGRIKIKRELKMRDIPAYCIKKAMEEIEEEDYEATLREVLEKKNALLKENNWYKRKNKLGQYALQKGYESELVWGMVAEVCELR